MKNIMAKSSGKIIFGLLPFECVWTLNLQSCCLRLTGIRVGGYPLFLSALRPMPDRTLAYLPSTSNLGGWPEDSRMTVDKADSAICVLSTEYGRIISI